MIKARYRIRFARVKSSSELGKPRYITIAASSRKEAIDIWVRRYNKKDKYVIERID